MELGINEWKDCETALWAFESRLEAFFGVWGANCLTQLFKDRLQGVWDVNLKVRIYPSLRTKTQKISESSKNRPRFMYVECISIEHRHPRGLLCTSMFTHVFNYVRPLCLNGLIIDMACFIIRKTAAVHSPTLRRSLERGIDSPSRRNQNTALPLDLPLRK